MMSRSKHNRSRPSDARVEPQLAVRAKSAVLSGEDIICLAHEPWHGPWKTYQQIMSLLARSNRVLYVGPPSSLRERIEAVLRRARRLPVIERAAANLFVYHEPSLLAKSNQDRALSRPFSRAASRLRVEHVRRVAQRMGFQSPLLWVFDPMQADVVGRFREKFVIYHVLDNYVELFVPEATTLRAAAAANHKKMLELADVVFAVSQRLFEECLASNPNSFLLPNGVNYESFRAAMSSEIVPDDLRGIPRPIIGYVGAIQSYMDFSLLTQVLAEHPEWSLVLVGPEELGSHRSRLDELLARPNAHYLGLKPVEDVPHYIKSCDVCIMPHRVDDLTVPADMIKVYEYLACGRPVVSMDIPSVRRFRPFVKVADGAREFVSHVESSLSEGTRGREARMAVAQQHTWQQRVEVLSEVIRRRLSSNDEATH